MRSALLALPAVLFLGLGLAHPDGPDPDPGQVERGKQIFETVCAACHTVNPPPDSAPPMAHVVRHLRMELETQEAFAEHVRSYVSAPEADRSLLPPMAIERFGLMGALPLGDSILTDVAAYIWTLADSARSGRGMGMGAGQMGAAGMRGGMEGSGMARGQGRGMMHRHGMQGDSATDAPAGMGRGGMCGMRGGEGGGMMHRHGAPTDTAGAADTVGSDGTAMGSGGCAMCARGPEGGGCAMCSAEGGPEGAGCAMCSSGQGHAAGHEGSGGCGHR